ncbi:hypothetical protein PKOR_16185 [Pontibacter korlensis]|uniref:Transposase n=1 Tax=Pontibacter korlensis TaxID=400092 RepID=A0A0E3UYC4_9BACT|nr:hypothetical protein PKOR_16185 [Pontibacter korlensis]
MNVGWIFALKWPVWGRIKEVRLTSRRCRQSSLREKALFFLAGLSDKWADRETEEVVSEDPYSRARGLRRVMTKLS